MEAITMLEREHRVIESVLECLARAIEDVRRGEPVPTTEIRSCLEFFRSYADQQHHHKEEEHLFPALEERGVRRESGPVGVMLEEHRFGRHNVATMSALVQRAEQGDASASEPLMTAALDYIALLRNHIAKEEGVLFPLAAQLLTEEEGTQMTAQFHQAGATPEHRAREERCLEIARELCSRRGVRFPGPALATSDSESKDRSR